MKLDVDNWNPKDRRFNLPHKFVVKLFDKDSKTFNWYTMEQVEKNMDNYGLLGSKEYKEFLSKAEKALAELNESRREGFTKHFPKKYTRGDEYVGEEIFYVENHLDGEISGPYYSQIAMLDDFHFKTGAWGIRKEVLEDIKNYDVEQIVLYDSFAHRNFYTTVTRYKIYGSEENGKVYLELRHFDIYEFRDYESIKPSKYDRFLKGLKINEKL